VSVLDQLAPRVIRYTYAVRMRRDGAPTPLYDIADTLNDAGELEKEKARTYNLPIMYIDHRQDFADQVDDGIYVVEVRTTSLGVPI
jgi:hypothetical protein